MNSLRRWSFALAYALGISCACAQAYYATDLSATNVAPINYAPAQVNGIMNANLVGAGIANNQSVPLLWRGTGTTVLNLMPPGYRSAAMYGFSIYGPVGYGATTSGQTQALLWPSPTPSAENINPVVNGQNAGFSEALGTSGTQIVGEAGASPTNSVAVLWSTPGTNAVDLHPSTNFVTSVATATDGQQQVGYATTTNAIAHAFLWSGGSTSATDLNPGGYIQSYATAVAPQSGTTNSVPVGYAETNSSPAYAHAFAWLFTGASNTPIPLNPSGYVRSIANGISGTTIVGYGITSTGAQNALLWQGLSSGNVVNLSTYLPSGATNAVATCINSTGNIGGYAMVGGQNHAIFWQPTSAPVFTSAAQNISIGFNVPYTFTNTASGVPPPTFSASGHLPSGFTLATNGILYGTGTVTGTYTGTFTASNGIAPAATQAFTYTVLNTPFTQYSTVGSFTSNYPGSVPFYAPISQDTSGNFYGITYNGGTSSFGSLWEMSPGGTETILHSFRDGSVTNDGGLATSVILGSSNTFYGTTAVGGATGNGTIYSYLQGSYNILHSFKDGSVTNDGSNPLAPLLQGNDGNYYGVADGGGTSNSGVVFQMTPTGSVTILHNFKDGSVTNDGATPAAPLIQASDGNFYGTTYNGGVNGYGTAYRLTPSGNLTLIHIFSNGTNDGRLPAGGLVQGTDGNFYGMATAGGAGGGGTIYRLTPSGTYTVLRQLGDGTVANDAAMPETGTTLQQLLVQGPDGNFYGTTPLGGSANSGAFFLMSPSGSMVVLHSFGDSRNPGEGTTPTGNLILGLDGSFYGETLAGGAHGDGTIFKFTVFSAPVFPSNPPTLTATAGQALNIAFTALGSPAPTYTVSGNLPTGLTLSSSGSLSGTPTVDGTYTFTITASNGFGNPASQIITLVVSDLATDTPTMPDWCLALLALLLVAAATRARGSAST